MDILTMEKNNIQEAAALAYGLNKNYSSSSAYCCHELESILGDFSNNMATSFCCIKNHHIVGVLSCYVDYSRNTSDCSLLIDEVQTDYNDAAWSMFSAARNTFGEGMQYNFFFPKENSSCREFLDGIGATKMINEYHLLLHHDKWNQKTSTRIPHKLQETEYQFMAALHDGIFPDAYISGADILSSLEEGTRRVYTITDNHKVLAYGVLRLKGRKEASAEVIGVREDSRHQGYGRAILNHLCQIAFTELSAEEIDLIVDGDNEKAISLYLDTGFSIEHENNAYSYRQ
ncbi:GNAT family N-acetyltransferase [Alloiococcus sp. CFN-8]|uniref:GNAT family N-acetyltransferase n=1 Tax=Alloiococcus sp. CFN-8 TaxID=3416081 RepID=UPI003CF2760A